MIYRGMTYQRAGQALLILFMLVLIVSGCEDSPTGATQEEVVVETKTIAQADEYLAINVQIPTFIGFPGADSINQLISTSADLAVAEIMGAALMMEQNEILGKATLEGS